MEKTNLGFGVAGAEGTPKTNSPNDPRQIQSFKLRNVVRGWSRGSRPSSSSIVSCGLQHPGAEDEDMRTEYLDPKPLTGQTSDENVLWN